MLTEQVFIRLTKKRLKELQKDLLLAAKIGFEDGAAGIKQKEPPVLECSENSTELDQLTSAEQKLALAFYNYANEKAKE